jgi:hypothetical protein
MGDRNVEQHTDPGNWQDTKHRFSASDTQTRAAIQPTPSVRLLVGSPLSDAR